MPEEPLDLEMLEVELTTMRQRREQRGHATSYSGASFTGASARDLRPSLSTRTSPPPHAEHAATYQHGVRYKGAHHNAHNDEHRQMLREEQEEEDGAPRQDSSRRSRPSVIGGLESRVLQLGGAGAGAGGGGGGVPVPAYRGKNPAAGVMGSPSPHNAAAIQSRSQQRQEQQQAGLQRRRSSLAAAQQQSQQSQPQQPGLAELQRGQLQLQAEVRNLSLQMEEIAAHLAVGTGKVSRRPTQHHAPGDGRFSVQ